MHEYNLDKDTHRCQTNSFKWNARTLEGDSGKLYPMWVADMEFEAASGIKEELAKRMHEGVFGYELLSDQYYNAVIYWLNKRHNCNVTKDRIVYCANTMLALSVILQTYTDPGDGVLLNTPAYGNFFTTIEGCKRKVERSPLELVDDRFTFNLSDMESKLTSNTKAFLLCNPHNPNGTVWTEDELCMLCEFCEKHGLLMISDEVHYDFCYQKHTMLMKIASEYDVPVFTLISPGKSFNLAGLQSANIIVPNASESSKLINTIVSMQYPFEHAFVEAATIGAYTKSENWFDAVYDYIKSNKALLISCINEHCSKLKVHVTEATYLLWVDCTGLGLADDALMEFWKDDVGILPSSGLEFGIEGSGYVRLNLACQKCHVERIVTKLKELNV